MIYYKKLFLIEPHYQIIETHKIDVSSRASLYYTAMTKLGPDLI